MGRDIRFRAWDKPNSRWYAIDGTDSFEIFEDERFAISQFTGLEDKNCKPIYEGDIISHQYGKKVGEVIWETPSYRVVDGENDIWIGHCDDKHIKVIGNIWENPELLETRVAPQEKE